MANKVWCASSAIRRPMATTASPKACITMVLMESGNREPAVSPMAPPITTAPVLTKVPITVSAPLSRRPSARPHPNNILMPTPARKTAKIFFSISVGTLCASLAPSGANSMLVKAMPASAGPYT